MQERSVLRGEKLIRLFYVATRLRKFRSRVLSQPGAKVTRNFCHWEGEVTEHLDDVLLGVQLSLATGGESTSYQKSALLPLQFVCPLFCLSVHLKR